MHDVHWTRRGTRDLAALCLDHPNEWAAIDAAEQDISNKLQRHPLRYSQEVSEGLRKIMSRPLVVYFSIDGDRVLVDAVGWIG